MNFGVKAKTLITYISNLKNITPEQMKKMYKTKFYRYNQILENVKKELDLQENTYNVKEIFDINKEFTNFGKLFN